MAPLEDAEARRPRERSQWGFLHPAGKLCCGVSSVSSTRQELARQLGGRSHKAKVRRDHAAHQMDVC